MRKGLSLVGLGLIFVCAFGALVARAQGQVRIVENSHSVRFSEQISFHLVAEHADTIKGVTLYYRWKKEPVTTRVIPDFSPGRHVEATFAKEIERGEIPPGTTFEYYWRLDLADGTRYDTDPVTFVYDDDRFSWQPLSAGMVTILFYGDQRNAALAQELLDRGKSTLDRLQSEVGVTLEAPVRVYVYRNAQDMTAALPRHSEGFDEQVMTLGIAIGDDTLLLLGDHPEVRQALTHELSHIVLGLATKNPYTPPPRWLDEGLAMYAEGELGRDNARALESAVRRDQLISVRSLSAYSGDASQVDLYYGEVYSLIDYLVRTYGRDKMGQFIRLFRGGIGQEDALQEVYGLSLDELDARWRESLGLQPRAGLGTSTTPSPQAGRPPVRSPVCPASSLLGAMTIALAVGLRRAGWR